MSFDAFSFLQNGLYEELAKQGFGAAEETEYEAGRAVMFSTAEVAYCLRYDEKNQRFQLCSATLPLPEDKDGWRSLSTWLFDQETGEHSDADSILNDFLEVIRGPKRVALVQQKRKRGKDDERNVDPMFFVNRLVNIFPELKEDLNEEKIMYGQVRFAAFLREKVAPQAEDLVLRYPDSEPCKKFCALLDDMYANGDMDLRSLMTITLLNTMNDEAFASLFDRVGEDLRKDLKYTRKLKGKKIKPEKKKQSKKKVESRLSQ